VDDGPQEFAALTGLAAEAKHQPQSKFDLVQGLTRQRPYLLDWQGAINGKQLRNVYDRRLGQSGIGLAQSYISGRGFKAQAGSDDRNNDCSNATVIA
jgi:hypothetical protein